MQIDLHTPEGQWPALVSTYLHSDHSEMIMPEGMLRPLVASLAYLAYEVEVFYEVDEAGTATLCGIIEGDKRIGRVSP